MKKVLIISPYFPPTNAADMQRVRQCISYLPSLNWNPIVITVASEHTEMVQDPILLKTIPEDLRIVKVSALPVKHTRKLGLGSIALRSLLYYRKKVNEILQREKIDLIFFSTTQFPVLILGNYWKKKFGVPYVIDMQDPWFSDYYLDKPKSERPPKFWFSYYLNRTLEPIAMKRVNAIVAVSEAYCQILQERYANITPSMCTTLTFGAFEKDFEVLEQVDILNPFFKKENGKINIVYVGRAGHDMVRSIHYLFEGFKLGLEKESALFEQVKFWFIGTSYAPKGKGKKTVQPIAQQLDISKYVEEVTDRVPYFQVLKLLSDADILVMPGSDDPQYTASKLYPYILAQKPLLAIFNEKSSVVGVLNETQAGQYVTFPTEETNSEEVIKEIYTKLKTIASKLPYQPDTNWQAFQPYTAKERTKTLVRVFDSCLEKALT